MAALGPFAPDRRVAVAVSGGADSMALAMLAAGWGRPLALVADHGLRPEAAEEARLTIRRLAERGIPARLLSLAVPRGPALAERARTARYQALRAACAEAGLPHLLLGHHAGDQAETVLLRALHGSGPDGRAGMAAIQSSGGLCLLRPLLGVVPIVLRDWLRAAGLAWVEDPSNANMRAERNRLRARIGEPEGQGPRTAALLAASRHWAGRRNARADAVRAWLTANVTLYPGLHAEWTSPELPADALAALIQTVTGALYPPAGAAVTRLAAAPRPATLAGARLLRGRGRWHLAREAAAAGPPVPACRGAVWDGRFLLADRPAAAPPGIIDELGPAAWRTESDLPAAVLAALPCVRVDNAVVAIPSLGIGDPGWRLFPVVNRPATGSHVNTLPSP